MKKLLNVLTGLCLLAGLFAGCEKKPLEESGDGKTTIEGVVTVKDTQTPLPLAGVTLMPTGRQTVTDSAGAFAFRDITPGTYRLQIKRSGYVAYTSGDIKVSAGKTVRHNVSLEALRSELKIQDAYGNDIEELEIDESNQGAFVIKNASDKIVEWEIPKLAVDWISEFSMQSGKLAPGASERVEFSIDRSKLSDGLNEAILYIGSNVGDNELLIKVGVERSFSLTDVEGKEILELDLTDSVTYDLVIRNTGNDVLTWSLYDIDSYWLTVDGEVNGVLAAGESAGRTLRVNLERLKESGTYESTLVFRSNAGEKTLPVKKEIELGFRVEDYADHEITEYTSTVLTNVGLRFRNTGNGIIDWEIPSVDVDWLSLDKYSGSIQPGSFEAVTFRIDRSDLPAGDNITILNILTNAGEKPFPFNVYMKQSYRVVNSGGVEVTELNLGRKTEGEFGIINDGVAMTWEIAPLDVDWLVLKSATRGELTFQRRATVKFTVDLNKVEGTDETTLHINSSSGDKELTIRFQGYESTVGSDYVETVGGVELPMVAVQGGRFSMGATEEQGSDAENIEKPVHQVLLDGYYIGKYEVTQAQWEEVMGTTVEQQRNAANPTFTLAGVGDDYPMYYVNWSEATAFCEELSRRTGKKYRLPTEAEWEYAARGGHNQDGAKYAGSNAVGQVAWYVVNSNDQTQPVGTKQLNGLGVYDMSGNVYEWCSDWYGSYSSSPAINPQGASSGSDRVFRGGSYSNEPDRCRVSFRNHLAPSMRGSNLGFRIVCEQ